MEFENKNRVYISLIVILLLGNIYLGIEYFGNANQAKQLQREVKSQQTNKQIVNFLNLFIEKVLKSERDVSFEDRLLLENAIRDTQDAELLAKWEAFTSASNEVQVQVAVKNLLEALVNKISF